MQRTEANKIEKGVRSDVSISQLFQFAEVLGTAPVNLLTPGSPEPTIELSPGGRVVTGADARAWIRGTQPHPDVDQIEYFFDLPVDEQREAIRRSAGDDLVWAAMGLENQNAYIATTLERLEGARKKTRKEKQ